MPIAEDVSTPPFSPEEVRKLIAACDRISSTDPSTTSFIRCRSRALVYTPLYSGLRIGDVALLRRAALQSFDGNDWMFQTDVTTAPLIQAANENFYGTTQYGGTNGTATVFKITPAGVFTSLYSFSGHTSSVGASAEEVVQGSYGSFYGAAGDAASNGYGTLFRMTSEGALSILHSFAGPDGEYATGLAQAASGAFYGLTVNSGTNSDGTTFALSLGLVPFVESVPTWGKVGRTIQILGTNLTGATAVTFNGIAAAFTVASARS